MRETENIIAALKSALQQVGSTAESRGLEHALQEFIREYITEEARRSAPWLRSAINQALHPGQITS